VCAGLPLAVRVAAARLTARPPPDHRMPHSSGACPNPEGEPFVSTLALLVLLLLVVVVLLLAAGTAYLVHRHPSWGQPLAAAFGAVTVMATLVGVILAR
jgi:hypothetical protein